MRRFEKSKRIIPAIFLLGIGATACNATADSPAKKPSSLACSTVKPAYENPISPDSVLIEPEPGLNSQYYMLIEQGGTAQVLQKDLKVNATEAQKTLNLNNLLPGEVRMVSFSDAAPGVIMEFKAEYMKPQISGQIATLVVPQVCSRTGITQPI